MPIVDILQLGNPELRKPASEVREPDSEAIRGLSADLRDTLLAHRATTGFGRGIAAPQLGAASRLIHVDLEGSWTLVNPVVSARSDETLVLWDFCFSYFWMFFPVRRHVLVEVTYQDLLGRDRKIEARGHLAELLQHEIDHLDGILAIDRVTDPKQICSIPEWKKRHSGDNEQAVREALGRLKD